VVGRTLDGEVERDLHPMPATGFHEMPEVLQRSDVGVDGFVPAVLAPDGVGAAGVGGADD